MHTTLISVDVLHSRLETAVAIDCRFDLANPEAGRQAFAEGHIPGARYAHLDTDLSGPKSNLTGRHPLPDSTTLAATFGRFGITSNTQVFAYDADNGMFASRLWWLLRWSGHRSVAVLDGGFKAWTMAGLPISRDAHAPVVANFRAETDDSLVVSADEVARRAIQSDWRILDARAPERFRGEVEPLDPVAGHIPGARNHPFAWNMGGDGRWLSPHELATKLNLSLDGVRSERAIMMCGSGVTACHNLLALEIAGLHGAKLYAGSWSEWIRDPRRPVVKGTGS